MRAPKPEKEDPTVVAAREREQARAEATRTEDTQALLIGQTQRRLRRFGKLPGAVAGARGGSVPIYGPAPTATGGATGGSGAASGGSGGAGFGGGSAIQDYATQVY